MFLVTVVTLVISIIALYAQVASVQVARLNAKQLVLAQTMVQWHKLATQLIIDNKAILSAATLAKMGGTGCQLTQLAALGAGAIPVCTTTTPSNLYVANPANPWDSHLPQGYQTTPYTFYSIAFTTAGVNYVATYVHDIDANGNIQLPESTTGTAISYGLNDLQQQMSRLTPYNISYGTVSGCPTCVAALKLKSVDGVINLSYATPSTTNNNAVVGNNAVILVSPAQ